jgi:hypothetical protein
VDRDAQDLLVLEAPELSELPLEEIVLLEARRDDREPLVEIGAEPRGVLLEQDLILPEQHVDELRVAQEALREEVGRAEEREQEPRHAPVLGEHPEVWLGVRERGGEVGEVRESLIGIGRAERVREERTAAAGSPSGEKGVRRRAIASSAARTRSGSTIPRRTAMSARRAASTS